MLKNKMIIEIIWYIVLIVSLILSIKASINISNNKKIECNQKGGMVVEGYFGIFENCVYKERESDK